MHIVDYILGTKLKSGYGSTSTAEEVTASVDLSGKVAIVTGASAGIGVETARVLALRGAHVVLAVRNMAAGAKVKDNITSQIPDAKVEIMELDLSSLKSVGTFADSFKAKNILLNILINNAGVMACPFALSADGYELQFATNHLGHFSLTNHLLPLLKTSAASSGSESRVVCLASVAHQHPYKGGISFDRLNDKKGYSAFSAYGQSKLANILFAKELARRLKEEGTANVTVNALCPGNIGTDLVRHLLPNPLVKTALMTVANTFLKSVPQGAATTCYVATSEQLNGVSGKYFYDSKEGPGKNGYVEDAELAKKLWRVSDEMVSKVS